MKRLWPWIVLAAACGSAMWFAPASVRFPAAWFVEPAPVVNEDGPSDDLASDLKLMWETGPMTWVADHASRSKLASTPEAIHAASRVFNTVELMGKTRTEVATLLGDPKSSSKSIYNFPFWPLPEGAMVYRFDTGAYGWQFNVVLEDDKVIRVERHWIH
ncbi:MAG TPA: hypothetical protein VH092_15120 [Urbifossiella sp.]|jgi:hypothetical protein|nr:hypothetical protein [Urbifossiella sp.]